MFFLKKTVYKTENFSKSQLLKYKINFNIKSNEIKVNKKTNEKRHQLLSLNFLNYNLYTVTENSFLSQSLFKNLCKSIYLHALCKDFIFIKHLFFLFFYSLKCYPQEQRNISFHKPRRSARLNLPQVLKYYQNNDVIQGTFKCIRSFQSPSLDNNLMLYTLLKSKQNSILAELSVYNIVLKIYNFNILTAVENFSNQTYFFNLLKIYLPKKDLLHFKKHNKFFFLLMLFRNLIVKYNLLLSKQKFCLFYLDIKYNSISSSRRFKTI